MSRKWEIIATWSLQTAVILVAFMSIGAFIGGWFIWGWPVFENIMMTIFDICVLCFSVIITYVIWSDED